MDTQLIILLTPLLFLQLGLMIWGLTKVIPRKTTKYLNKIIWILIIALVSIFGPIAYLILEGDE